MLMNVRGARDQLSSAVSSAVSGLLDASAALDSVFMRFALSKGYP